MLGTTRPWGVAMATPMLTWRWQITALWSAAMLALTKGQSRSARPAACRGYRPGEARFVWKKKSKKEYPWVWTAGASWVSSPEGSSQRDGSKRLNGW